MAPHTASAALARPASPASLKEKLIATWGVLCVSALLGQALVRLTPLALEPLRGDGLSPALLALYVAWVAFNAYAEGWRGFHLKFAPRVVARAFYLGRHPKPLWLLLALPFCMSLFHATRRQRIVSWVLIVVLTGLIVAVRALPQPWRGIVDGGVVVGLGLGLASVIFHWMRGLAGTPPPVTDLPRARD
ncbi:MAG: hypothetical protein AAF447_24105 [Myxococcota bacterium]